MACFCAVLGLFKGCLRPSKGLSRGLSKGPSRARLRAFLGFSKGF